MILALFVDELFAKLEMHLASLPKVTLIRLNKARGLMVARQTGIERSRSDYFIVMDSHMEVNTGTYFYHSHVCTLTR